MHAMWNSVFQASQYKKPNYNEVGMGIEWTNIEYLPWEVMFVNYFILQYAKGARVGGSLKEEFKIKSDILKPWNTSK